MTEKLSLEVITPDGVGLKESEIDVVVFRRREKRFEWGSEIAIFPLHAPLLVRIPVAPVRYRRGSQTFFLAVAGGYVEVKNNRITIITPRFKMLPLEEAHPSSESKKICQEWSREQHDFQSDMVGYLQD